MTSRITLAILLSGCCLSLVAKKAPEGKDAPKAAAPSPASTPGAPKPFDEVIKGAKEEKGYLTLWRKDDKTWIELVPEQFNKPFFFSFNLRKGLGERGFYSGMMGDSQLAVWRQVGPQLQLVALNPTFKAKGGTPMARAIGDSFSESLIASSPIASAPHGDRKSVLVDANALLISDIPGAASNLEAVYRQPYGFDKANSSLAEIRSDERQTSILLNAHFSLSRRMLPPVAAPGAPRPAQTPLPGTLPDFRSLFLGYQLNFMALPENPMASRAKDDRVGYFATTCLDFTDDLKPRQERQILHRWRLEKADPALEISEPKQPIVYWLDRNIPEKFRKVVTDGILEWNKAFEKIGFKNAVVVKQQPDDADWDTTDARHASIRWMVGSDLAFAIGPSMVDPRTGEILDADIGIGEFWSRMLRAQRRDELPVASSETNPFGSDASGMAHTVTASDMADLGFGMDLLEARLDLDPESPEVESYILAFMKDLVTHEVGHTLGLRHNFKASSVYTEAQLQDPAFTQKNGIAGSVMEYNALNLALEGQKQGDYVQATLGPWDYWVIEYGYKPIAPEKEAEELEAIAARGAKDPLLAYSTDEDAGFGGPQEGMDPDVNRRDLGSDPLAFAQKRVQLSRELWNRLQNQPMKKGQDFDRRRTVFMGALNQVSNATIMASKYIGGVSFVYDGPESGNLPLRPVPGSRQREALKLLEQAIFNVDAFRFKPEFVATLVPNSLTRRGNPAPDPSLSQIVSGVHQRLLQQLYQPVVAQRILDTPDKVQNPKEAFRLSELYDGLQSAIWSELKTGKDVGLMRRNLQREHLNILAHQVLRGNGAPADARALARQGLKTLQAQLKAAMVKPAMSKEAKAHFADCLATLEESLKASLQRTL